MSTMADDIWAILHELAQSQKETDRKFQETDKKFQETDRKIKEMTGNIGKLGNRLGEFIEDAVRPAVVRLFRQRGIDVHEVHRNVSSQNEGMKVSRLICWLSTTLR